MEKLHFDVDLGHFLNTSTSILFESSEEMGEYGTLWHTVFDDSEESNKLLERFLKETYPEGSTIGMEQLKKVKDKAFEYLITDEKCIKLKAKIDKRRYRDSYVYFEPYNKVYPCGFCEHLEKVEEILKEFFKGATDDLTVEYLEKFIRKHIEVVSDNTTTEIIAGNSRFFLQRLQGLER